jgi:hypothetical protein
MLQRPDVAAGIYRVREPSDSARAYARSRGRGRNRFDRCLLVLEYAKELAGGVVGLKAARACAAQEADAAIDAG